MTAKNLKSAEQLEESKMIAEAQAVDSAILWVKNIYQKDTGNWSISALTDKYPEDTTYKIKMFEPNTTTEYSVTINGNTGSLIEIQCIYNGKTLNHTSGLIINSNKMQKHRKNAIALLRKLTKHTDHFVCYCEYRAEENILLGGTISYVFKLNNGSGYIIRYSLNSKEYYDILFIENFEDYKTILLYHAKTSDIKKTVKWVKL